MGMLAIGLSFLGRYDTFSDIVFTMMLFSHTPITSFTIFGREFQIPLLPLHLWSLFAVVVGVYMFQALPGMVMLCARKNFPMAFKFNEFNFLLAMIELEVQDEV